MLKNILQYSIAPLIIIGLSSGIYLTQLQTNGLIQSLLIDALAAISVALYISLLNPPIWIIKLRFWITGTMFGLFLTLQYITLSGFYDSDHFLVDLIIAVVAGNMTLGLFLYLYFKNIKNKTYTILTNGEREIVCITGHICIDTHRAKGRFILTNKRIILIENNRGRSQYDFLLKNNDNQFKYIYRFGLPNGLKLSGHNLTFEVIFPRFWKAQMAKASQQTES